MREGGKRESRDGTVFSRACVWSCACPFISLSLRHPGVPPLHTQTMGGALATAARLPAALVWAIIYLLRWVETRFLHPIAAFFIDDVTAAWEEGAKSLVRESFAALTRGANGVTAWLLSLLVDRRYWRTLRAEGARSRRGVAWEAYWKEARPSTLNAVVARAVRGSTGEEADGSVGACVCGPRVWFVGVRARGGAGERDARSARSPIFLSSHNLFSISPTHTHNSRPALHLPQPLPTPAPVLGHHLPRRLVLSPGRLPLPRSGPVHLGGRPAARRPVPGGRGRGRPTLCHPCRRGCGGRGGGRPVPGPALRGGGHRAHFGGRGGWRADAGVGGGGVPPHGHRRPRRYRRRR